MFLPLFFVTFAAIITYLNKKRTKNMKHIRHCLTALFAIALSLMVWADSGELFTSGKLSSSLINCIVQDKYGYIWVGTEYGLSKFDGYRFTNYLHNEEDTTSITDNIISDLLVDKKGNLWIGCAKGLMRYNYETNNFSRLQFPDGRKPRIYSMVESHRGDILLGTAGYGLYSVKNNGIEKTANNRFTIRWERAYAERDSDVFFTHIYEDKHHYLWQSSHLSTFTRFIEKQGKVQRKDFKSPYGAPVAFIQHRPQAMLIVCMYGIIYYDYRTGRIADAGYDLGTFKNHVTINNATFDHDGNLYISTSEHGALIIKKGSSKVEQLENSNSNFNLSTAFVNDIIEDKDNNLWIAVTRKVSICSTSASKPSAAGVSRHRTTSSAAAFLPSPLARMAKHGVRCKTVAYSVLMLQERLSPTLPRQQAPASSTKTAGVHTGSATEVRSTATIRIREPIRKSSPLPAQVSTA